MLEGRVRGVQGSFVVVNVESRGGRVIEGFVLGSRVFAARAESEDERTIESAAFGGRVESLVFVEGTDGRMFEGNGKVVESRVFAGRVESRVFERGVEG